MGVINYTKVLRKNLQDLTEPAKTYAVSQSRGRMNVDALAKHMSEHNTPFSKGVIKGILEDFITCTRELITDGWIVDLGNMGTFNVQLKTVGVCESVVDPDTGKKPVFDTTDIKEVNCLYVPGPAFENMISGVIFNEVASRARQSELLKVQDSSIEAGTWLKQDSRKPVAINGD